LDKAVGRNEPSERRGPGDVATDIPSRPPTYRASYVLEGTLTRGHDIWKSVRGRISFWTVVLTVTGVAAIYLYLFSESMFVSEAVISLQNKSGVSSGISSVLSSGLASAGTSNEDAALVAYIQSPDMLVQLDKKFHLRDIYSDYRHNPFWRLDKNASNEGFLTFYQNMVEIALQPDVNLITLDVLDYNAERAREIADTIINEAERFMNQMSDTIREQTLRAAKQELQEAETQAATAPASERDIAERRLSAAQVAMATALSLANSQQVFVVRISNPTLPTQTTRPERLLDLAAVATLTAVFYAIFFMIMSNVRDHRRL